MVYRKLNKRESSIDANDSSRDHGRSQWKAIQVSDIKEAYHHVRLDEITRLHHFHDSGQSDEIQKTTVRS